MGLIARLRAGWCVLRHGLPEVIFSPAPGQDYKLPNFHIKGPIFVGIDAGTWTYDRLIGRREQPDIVEHDGRKWRTLGKAPRENGEIVSVAR